MFFHQKHKEALEMQSSTEVSASIYDVFGALALRSIHNRYNRAGLQLLPFPSDPYRFEMFHPDAPDEIYIITETLCEPYHSYIMTLDYPPGLYDNFLVETTYFYQLESLSADTTKVSCRRRFLTRPFLVPDMENVTAACQSSTDLDLQELKTLIESGAYPLRSSRKASKLSA